MLEKGDRIAFEVLDGQVVVRKASENDLKYLQDLE
jgi:hypothetical protein